MARQRKSSKTNTTEEGATQAADEGGTDTTISHKPVEAMPETGATAAAADAIKETEELGDSIGVEAEKKRIAAEKAGAPKAAVTEVRRYRVMQDRSINMRGQRALLRSGKIIDTLNYPIDHLKNQGVMLEELK